MSEQKPKKERLLTTLIIVFSVIGILYFGGRAVYENTRRGQKNPFEYDVEYFKQSGTGLVSHLELRRLELDLDQALAIAIGPDDELFVSGDNVILSLDGQGRIRHEVTANAPVYCLAVDDNGDVYAGLSDHIEVFDGRLQIKKIWDSPGGETVFTSIATSPDAVYVADAGNLIVWHFDKEGNLIKRIGDRDGAKDVPGFIIPSPYFDVAVDPDGFLWAADTGRHSLQNYNPDGGIRTIWGEFSLEIQGFCGCCNPSHFSVLEDGRFVTSEKGIPRVKIYNRLGELASVVAGPDLFREGTVGLDLAADSRQRIYILDPAQKAVRIFERKKDEERSQ